MEVSKAALNYLDTSKGFFAISGVTRAEAYINPIPSGLVLTGIVVSVSVSAFSLALIQRIHKKYGTINLKELIPVLKDGE